MRTLLCALTVLAANSLANAQADDIGLYMQTGTATVIHGQDCGPLGCQPFPGGAIVAGEGAVLTHFSAAATVYAIAVGLPGPCLQVPGIDNPFLLGTLFVTSVGITSAPPIVPLPCDQGIAIDTFVVPPSTPPGLVIRFQSIGVSLSTGSLAFGPAIEATIV